MSLEILALTGVILVALWMEDCRQRVLWEVKNGEAVQAAKASGRAALRTAEEHAASAREAQHLSYRLSSYSLQKDIVRPPAWLLDPRSLRGVKPHSSERSTGATSAGA